MSISSDTASAGIAAYGRSDLARGKQPARRSWFFLAADPAPAQSAKADDGALVILRAEAGAEMLEDPEREAVPGDFELGFVYARKLRNAGVRQWSGVIHALHDRFSFANIVLDSGAGGGGGMIRKELASSRQLYVHEEVERVPIVTRDSVDVVQGQFLLTLAKCLDPGVAALWPGLGGTDVLNDYLHANLKEALDHALLAFPKPRAEWSGVEWGALTVEQQWTVMNLDEARAQLARIVLLTKPDGTPLFTSRNARRFQSSGKDDLAMGCAYAYLAFLVWLKLGGAAGEGGGGLAESDYGDGW